METKQKYWTGNIGDCDICHTKLREDFFDARTVRGPWATLCRRCWQDNTLLRLGTGQGQHYRELADGRWLKVAG